MIIKAGNAVSNSDQSMLAIDLIMKEPTIIKMGAVTSDVTTANKGEKNKLRANMMATTTAVKPVRPPTAIPVEDSI